MRIRIDPGNMAGSGNRPSRVFRKWVLIGAAVGALLVGLAGMLILALAMMGGAIVGAALGAVYGAIKAAIAAVSRS